MSMETDPTSWVRELWGSLSRAGGHLSEDGSMEGSGQELHVKMRFKDKPAEDAHPHITKYIRAFAQEAGWSIQSVGVRKDHIAFSASSARSNETRKRSTSP